MRNANRFEEPSYFRDRNISHKSSSYHRKTISGNQKNRNNFHSSSSFLARPYFDIQNDVNFGGMRAEQKNAIIVKTKTILVQTNAIIVKKKEIIVQKICNYCANKTIFIAQKIQLM